MKKFIALLFLALSTLPTYAEEYERDNGIGSYSNVYGGTVKVCCDDYRYYRRDRNYFRPHRWRRR